MILFIFMMILGLLTGVVFLSNPDPATFFFFKYGIEAPKTVMLLLFFLAGIFFAKIWQSLLTIPTKRIYQEFSRKITELEGEVREKDKIISRMKEKEQSADFSESEICGKEQIPGNNGKAVPDEP